jgi:hypothetical protein
MASVNSILVLLLLLSKKRLTEVSEKLKISTIARHCVVAIALLLALGVTACSGAASNSNPTPEMAGDMVRGLIQNVDGKSLLELESLTIEDDSGKLWTFEARGKIIPNFTPSHLNEHKVLGMPVTVEYHREGDALVIDDITD